MAILQNKYRFLSEIINGTLFLFLDKKARDELEIIQDLTERKYDKFPDGDSDLSYLYLLKLQIRNISLKNLEDLKNNIGIS